MIFIVTDKLKHKTRIEGIGKKVKSGDILFLTESDVSKTTISKWLSNDLIKNIGDIDFPPNIIVKNKTTKSLNLGNYILKSSQEKTLSEKMFDRNIVLKLILKDYLVVDEIKKEDIDELKSQIEEEEVKKEEKEEEQNEGIKAWEANEQKLKTQKPIEDQDNIINVNEEGNEEESNKKKSNKKKKENKTKKQEESIELDSKGNPVSNTLNELVDDIKDSEDDVDIINDEEGVELDF